MCSILAAVSFPHAFHASVCLSQMASKRRSHSQPPLEAMEHLVSLLALLVISHTPSMVFSLSLEGPLLRASGSPGLSLSAVAAASPSWFHHEFPLWLVGQTRRYSPMTRLRGSHELKARKDFPSVTGRSSCWQWRAIHVAPLITTTIASKVDRSCISLIATRACSQAESKSTWPHSGCLV
ncbi:uncharacterized protein LAESUDRAFT_304626 [Laetiporus sulphureus 93-53]|uniref:Uncharacterized protein n=1 Tax=Laetiporus sulphureus 93-53 TaxID=1314785 RepID=A0A165D8D5_9APHY|nr:uncharacterized protein LAESUDRAFT_304626 [Laetiporus sulphureus 93-53]KZT04320.1 hypothetical protein LAESUDRAFT_304626 [Laetiporus sulphureus 93-53]